MRIAVLGAAGQMGKLLVEYLSDQDHNLTLSDIKKAELKRTAKTYGAEIAKDDVGAVEDAELVIVSVPAESTAQVISEIAPLMQPKSIMVEISSIKSGVIDTLKKIHAYGVRPVSLHPLFGPGIAKKLRKKIALIPVLNVMEEKKLAKTVFPDAKLIVVDAEVHDRVMAVVLSLSYSVNMTLASVLVDEDIKLLKELSGPTFRMQLLVTESIMAQKPELHASLQITNKYAPSYLRKFLDNLTMLTRSVEIHKAKEFELEYERVQKKLASNLDLPKAYQELYQALQFLEKSKR